MGVDVVKATTESDKFFFQPRRLGHVNLIVDDVDETMDFYYRIVGLNEAYRRPQVDAGFLTNGNTHHDIGMVGKNGPSAKGRPWGLNHVAFELETEVDLVNGYKHAIDRGVSFLRTADHDIAHAVYGADPDGNQCEIYADVIKDWWKARSGTVNKPKPDWTPGSTPPNPNHNYQVAPEPKRVDDAVFHALRVSHATLVLENFQEGVRYYCDVVGLKPKFGDSDSDFVILSGTLGGADLGLFRAGPGRVAGLHHFGLPVASEEELESSLEAYRTAGAEPELVVENAIRRSVFIRDPNGIGVQLYADRGAPLSELARYSADIALFTM